MTIDTWKGDLQELDGRVEIAGLTHDTWHLTPDTWWGWTLSQNFSSPGLSVWDRQYLKNILTNHDLLNEWMNELITKHGAVRGSRQGLFPPRRFLRLHQPPGNDLTSPLSPTYPSWSGESAVAPAAGTSWPRIAPRSSERSWRPLTLDGAGWKVLYLISCKLMLIHSRSIDIWATTALPT